MCEEPDGAGTYDKYFACYFCHKLCKSKLKRHMQTVHAEEPATGTLVSKSKKGQERGFGDLKTPGNFNHNVKVLERGIGR